MLSATTACEHSSDCRQVLLWTDNPFSGVNILMFLGWVWLLLNLHGILHCLWALAKESATHFQE